MLQARERVPSRFSQTDLFMILVCHSFFQRVQPPPPKKKKKKKKKRTAKSKPRTIFAPLFRRRTIFASFPLNAKVPLASLGRCRQPGAAPGAVGGDLRAAIRGAAPAAAGPRAERGESGAGGGCLSGGGGGGGREGGKGRRSGEDRNWLTSP